MLRTQVMEIYFDNGPLIFQKERRKTLSSKRKMKVIYLTLPNQKFDFQTHDYIEQFKVRNIPAPTITFIPQNLFLHGRRIAQIHYSNNRFGQVVEYRL